MAVYLHNDVSSVTTTTGGHEHTKEESLERDHRTWAIECSNACEAEIIAKVAQSANSAKGVPLSPDEQRDAAIEKEAGNLSMATMARVLTKMAENAATAPA